MIGIPAIDINSLTDEDLVQLTAAGDKPAPQATARSGAIDINSLTDADLASINALGNPVGSGEAAARLFYKHLTFGTEPGVDRQRTKQAAEEHPYINMASAIPATVAQMAVLGPLAAAGKGVQGAGMLASAARGAGSATELAMLPNMKAGSAVLATRTGAKLGGNYSAAEALGSDLTDPDKSWGQTAKDVGMSYGVGTVLGGGLGAGAHGLSRTVGAVANRTMPHLAEARAAARAPEAQGIRDIARHAGYDDADLSRLAQTLEQAKSDPGLAARYADLNLIEALKASALKPTSAGELKPQVVTTRNLDDLAKHWANTEGRGQNIAADAFASRKNETSAKMQGDIDQFFGTAARDQDAAGIAARREAVGNRYNKLRDSGNLVQVHELGKMQQVSPVFDKALRYAAENDAIANPGSQWGSLWSGGKLGDTVVTLSPSNMLDIHHALVMNAKPPIGGATPESVMAGKLKSWFTDWADRSFVKHKTLREDYTHLRRVMEATERGADLPATGSPSHPSLTFLKQQMADLPRLEDAVTKMKTKMAIAAQDGASQKSLNSYKGHIARVERLAENRREVVDEFRKAWGDARKQELAMLGDNGPAQVVKKMTTQEGKRRIMQILGPEDGRAYIESLYNKALQQRLGNTLYGGPDTAFKQQKRETLDALSNAASGIALLSPKAVWDATRELASSAYRQRRADRGNEVMAQQGVNSVLPIVKSLEAQQALRTTAHPFVRNPLFRATGPVGNVDPPTDKKKQRLLP